MKFALALIVPFVMAGHLALAADAEDKDSTTVDHSKNIITGTKTTTRKHKEKVKTAHGGSAEENVTETTKVHKDGKVDHSTKVDAEATQKGQ